MAGQDGEFVINLRRNNVNTSWGFRLQGGKEFNTYLSVQRVFNGSPAQDNLHRGDVIVAIDNEDVTQWYQKQAQDFIQSIGLTLALVVLRGGSVPRADAKPSQAQPVPSFVRKPFGQQQQQYQPVQQPQLSPQLTSKTTLQFQPSSYNPPTQPLNDLENVRPSAGITWTPHQAPTGNLSPGNSFSTPLQVRTVQQVPRPYSSYSPQQRDAFSHHGQAGRVQQPTAGTEHARYQQDYSDRGPTMSHGMDSSYQRDAVHSAQQPDYEESNHVSYNRKQHVGSSAHEVRNEPTYPEVRKEGEEEEDDYQQMSVCDIKQMFNKPDQKDNRAVSRVKKSPAIWTRPSAEGPVSPGGYGAPGLGLGYPSSLAPTKPMTGSIQRGPPPSDDFRKSFSPPARSTYGQPRYDSPPGKPKAAAVTVNKLGGAFAGIIQPALPAKTPPKPAQKGAQKKKDFDPNQSAVYKMLLEEEERAKNQPAQQEEEEEEAPRRQAQNQRPAQRQPQKQQQQQQQQQQQGSRLTELLERDATQLAPYKDKSRSTYQEQRPPQQEPRSPYQEPRSPYQQEPRALYQVPSPSQSYGNEPPQGRGPPPRGSPSGAARQPQPGHYSSYDHNSAFLQTQYVDGIPTSDF